MPDLAFKIAVIVIIGNAWFLGLALGTLHVGRKLRKIAVNVVRDGKMVAGSGFFGQPKKDIKINKFLGYYYLLMSLWWLLTGWVSLIMIPIWSIGLPYLGTLISNYL